MSHFADALQFGVIANTVEAAYCDKFGADIK
jgi:hypothetical protein